MVTSTAVGVPAMAATSLRQRASALRPIFSGGVSLVKWIPSTLASDFFRRRVLGEMDSFDDCVGFEQQQFVRQTEIKHGAIISRAVHDGFVRRQREIGRAA